MSTTLTAPVGADEHRRSLVIVRALLARIADQLEELDHDRTLSDKQKATVNAGLDLALVAGEELDTLV